MFIKLKDKAKFFYYNGKYDRALELYEDIKKLDYQRFKKDCLQEYIWCLYIVKINTNDPFSIKNLPETKKHIKYILTYQSNKDKVFQYTVLKVLKYFKKKPIFEAEKIDVWLDKLDPNYLSDIKYYAENEKNEEVFLSHKEEWYDLKFKVCDKLEMYDKCLILSREAIQNVYNSDYKGVWLEREKLMLKHIIRDRPNKKYPIAKSQENQQNNLDKIIKNDGNKYKKCKTKVIKESTNKVYTEMIYPKGSKVKHSVFGIGIVLENDKKIIKVRFDNGEQVNFNYESVSKENVLEYLKDESSIDKLPLEKLKRLSQDKVDKKEFDYRAIKINNKIIEKGCRDMKYLIRLARCYKNLNQIEEATNIYNLVLKIDKFNREAEDYIQIYGKGYLQKFEDKPYAGVFRDVGSPPVEEVEKWYLDQQEKILMGFQKIQD